MSETRVGPGQQSVAFPSFPEWGSGVPGEGSPVPSSLKKATGLQKGPRDGEWR